MNGTIHRQPRLLTLACLGFALVLLGGCASKASKPSSGEGEVSFPDPQKGHPRGGTFVNLENLRQVMPGLNKSQLYALLGTPHFNEGLFAVHKWNYLFNFRGPGGVLTCQYQIEFGDDSLLQSVHWKPDACKAVVEPPPAEPAPGPAPAAAALPSEPIRLAADALFGFDKAELTEQGRGNIDKLLQQVRDASAVQDISVIGYTDRIGNPGYNLGLSLRRARAVSDYLSAHGVPAAALHPQGLGADSPITDCQQSKREELIACLAPNRRVEISGVARP